MADLAVSTYTFADGESVVVRRRGEKLGKLSQLGSERRPEQGRKMSFAQRGMPIAGKEDGPLLEAEQRKEDSADGGRRRRLHHSCCGGGEKTFLVWR